MKSKPGRIDKGACMAIAAMGLAAATVFAQPLPGSTKCSIVSPCYTHCNNGCSGVLIACCCRNLTTDVLKCLCISADACQNDTHPGWKCNLGAAA